jgi:hypothetical protein
MTGWRSRGSTVCTVDTTNAARSCSSCCSTTMNAPSWKAPPGHRDRRLRWPSALQACRLFDRQTRPAGACGDGAFHLGSPIARCSIHGGGRPGPAIRRRVRLFSRGRDEEGLREMQVAAQPDPGGRRGRCARRLGTAAGQVRDALEHIAPHFRARWWRGEAPRRGPPRWRTVVQTHLRPLSRWRPTGCGHCNGVSRRCCATAARRLGGLAGVEFCAPSGNSRGCCATVTASLVPRRHTCTP